MKKKCIINYSSGGWYPKGGERLKNRLKELEFDGETIIAINKLPVFCKPHSEVPYMFKPYMFLLALDLGFEQVIWMDSAIYPVKKIDPLFDILKSIFIYNNDELIKIVSDQEEVYIDTKTNIIHTETPQIFIDSFI